MKKITNTVLPLLLCLVLSVSLPNITSNAAKKKTAANTKVKSITLNHKNITLKKGKTCKLKATCKPKQKKKVSFTFSSTNTKVAKVDKTGKITARKAGTAKIKVKVKNSKVSAVCKVTVTDKQNNTDKTDDNNNNQEAKPDDNNQGNPSDDNQDDNKDDNKDDNDMNDNEEEDIYSTPPGFASKDKSIKHGEMTEVSYYSTVTENTRKCMIYTPPEYSTEKKYNVLYCMHGIGGDHMEWYRNGAPQNILDNLYAKGKLADMIVVFPNGRAMHDDSVPANMFSAEAVQAFSNFENDLKQCLMPFIKENYNIYEGRDHTAMAGLSMGGMQTVNIGLKNLELFNYYGIFSPAPTTDANLMGTNKDLYPKVLWLSVGISDTTSGQMAINTHNILTQKGVPHIYYRMPGTHDWSVWKNGLYNFAQLIFK